MTRKQLHRLLYEAGIDVQDFNRPGYKTLEHLEEEVDEQEIECELVGGKFLKISQSVKIFITAEDMIFHEIARDFGCGRFVSDEQPWGVSGTLKRGETHQQAAVRETNQEQGIAVSPTQLIPWLGKGTIKGGISKAYPHNILSRSLIRWFRLPLDKRFAERAIVTDNGVDVHHRWDDWLSCYTHTAAKFGTPVEDDDLAIERIMKNFSAEVYP